MTEWKSEATAAVWKEIFQLRRRWASGRSYSEEAVLHLTPPPGFMMTAERVWVHFQDKVISAQVPQAKLKQEWAKDKGGKSGELKLLVHKSISWFTES